MKWIFTSSFSGKMKLWYLHLVDILSSAKMTWRTEKSQATVEGRRETEGEERWGLKCRDIFTCQAMNPVVNPFQLETPVVPPQRQRPYRGVLRKKAQRQRVRCSEAIRDWISFLVLFLCDTKTKNVSNLNAHADGDPTTKSPSVLVQHEDKDATTSRHDAPQSLLMRRDAR